MRKPTHALTCAGSDQLEADRVRVVDSVVSSGALSAQSLPRIVELVDRFCGFCATQSVWSLADVSDCLAESFIQAPTSAGEPAPSTMHLRRSALRSLFRTARELGLADSDPTVDVRLPPRSQLKTRPLSDDEVALCRAASMHSLTSTRLAAAWALAEASARSAELGHIRVSDIDLDGQRVWLHGSPRTEPRRGPLTLWGATQIERRVRAIGDDPDRLVVYDGDHGTDYHRQAASCVVVSDTLRRAGLAMESDVRPLSVVAWAGQQVLAKTGRIDEVARRLGVRSLDRTAALIGFDWALAAIDEDGPR